MDDITVKLYRREDVTNYLLIAAIAGSQFLFGTGYFEKVVSGADVL